MPDWIRIPPSKITQYLLDLGSPRGESKARFFIEVCGFSPEDPSAFAEVLARHPYTAERNGVRHTRYGPQVEFVCEIDTPARGAICVLSAWSLLPRGAGLQLLTARPLSKQERRERGPVEQG